MHSNMHLCSLSDPSADARPGQGILFSTASNSFRAVDCSANQYGLPNRTYGLSAYPCRTCPDGMTTSRVFAASAQYFEDYGNGRGGFRSAAACITMPGFGYSGRAAVRCPVGTWNAPGAMGACTHCPYGLSTPDDPWGQMSEDNCTLAAGFGFHDNVVVPCPVGKCSQGLLVGGSCCGKHAHARHVTFYYACACTRLVHLRLSC